mmetsp:Transcript_30177/g.86150  ORF Transcript_30177/g.86150 Transcript_30177/m.86150 type:complete len:201 (+) Transcript_30177:242-844(+)
MTIAEGRDTHNNSVIGSNLSLLFPVINFCWSVTFADRNVFDTKQSSIAMKEKLTSPTVDIAHPMATATVGTSSHRSKGKPARSTVPTVKRQVVEPIISKNATEANPNAMLFKPMEMDAAKAIGETMNTNSTSEGCGITPPGRARSATRQTRPQLTKCSTVRNFGNLKAHSTKTHFTTNFMVERAMRYDMMLNTTRHPRWP